MSGSIYKCYTGRPTEAWYALTPEQQQQKFAQIDEARKAAGGKTLIICNSSWASDHTLFFGVEEFPDIDSVQQFHAALMKLEWSRYVDSQSVLGTKWE